MLRNCSTLAVRAAKRSNIVRTFRSSVRRRAILGEGDQAAFEEHVVKGNKLVFVDFHADVSDSYWLRAAGFCG